MSSTSNSSLDFKCNAICKSDLMESEKFTFVWEIPKFSSRLGVSGYSFLSKEFTIEGPGCKLTNWCGKIFPNGSSSEYKNYTSVFLFNYNDENVIVKCSIMTLDSKKKRNLESKKYMHMQEIEAVKSWGWDTFFDRTKEIAKHVHNDTLGIVFDVTVAAKVEFIEPENCLNKIESLSKNFHQDQMSNDFGLLYSNKDFADVTITCGNKKFECHKITLSSRSPVFKAMFTSNSNEQNMGMVSIEIKNMNSKVLENLLQYIYSCETPDIDELAKELYVAANEYQIEKLKELSEVKLCTNVKADNCMELLIFGDKYEATNLKTTALRFVAQNMTEIDVDECRKTLISNPSLLFELMNIMLPKMK